MADFIPKKKLKGTNPLPWINGSIINLINKKDSIRKKLKQRASSLLREKFRTLRSEIKRRLRECRVTIFVDMESILKSNPKCFWSVLRAKSKPKTSLKRLPWQPVTTQESRPHSKRSCGIIQPVFCVSIRVCSGNSSAWKGEWSVTRLRPILDWCNSLSIWSCYCTRLVTCKNLRETTDLIAPSLTELFNKSLRLGCLPEDWKLANIVLVFKKYNKEQRKTTDRSRYKFLLFLKWWRGAYIFNAIRDHVFNLISARRNTRLVKSITVRRSAYLTRVSSHLGYATQVWTPQLIDLIRYKVYAGSIIHLWPNI